MSEVEQKERRRQERQEANIGLTLRVPAQPVSARILDVSTRGCRVELVSGNPEQGATIIFDMPNGDRMTGQVMWTREKEAGVRFAHALRPATAKALGLESEVDAQVVVEEEVTEDNRDKGLLKHWYRELTRLFR